MSFVDRLRNSLFDICIVAARTIQGALINALYRRNGFSNVHRSAYDLSAYKLKFRSTCSRLKPATCSTLADRNSSSRPFVHCPIASNILAVRDAGKLLTWYNVWYECIRFRDRSEYRTKSPPPAGSVTAMPSELLAKRSWLDLSLLEKRPFVLVSFGSVTKVGSRR